MSHDLSQLRALWQSGRPLTDLYGFILPLYGFWFHNQISLVTFLTMGVFAAVTMSIMRYNNLIDAEHDQQKGRWVATRLRWQLKILWLVEALLICAGLAWLWLETQALATYIGLVWLVALAYSHIPHWFIVQNVVVAVCSGSPALCVAVYVGVFTRDDLYTFALFTSLIWVSEVHKDIDDAFIDPGYKNTLATRLGTIGAMLVLVPSLHFVAVFFLWHPSQWLWVVGVILLPYMATQQARYLCGRVGIEQSMKTMNHVIAACGVALFAPLVFS